MECKERNKCEICSMSFITLVQVIHFEIKPIIFDALRYPLKVSRIKKNICHFHFIYFSRYYRSKIMLRIPKLLHLCLDLSRLVSREGIHEGIQSRQVGEQQKQGGLQQQHKSCCGERGKKAPMRNFYAFREEEEKGAFFT